MKLELKLGEKRVHRHREHYQQRFTALKTCMKHAKHSPGLGVNFRSQQPSVKSIYLEP